MTRDFAGYGNEPPDPQWPGGALLAINIVINVEEGSESSFADGDGFSESALTELGAQRSDVVGRDLAAESMFEYGARVGIWRLFNMLEGYDVPCTVFGCALALQRLDAVAQHISAQGYDVCAHGLRWVKHYELNEEEERRQVAEAVRVIEATTGAPPLGWYCRYGPSEQTRRILIQHGGFFYDSDSYADELPYWVEEEGHAHLVVPYALSTNDTKFVRGGVATATQFYEFLSDSVEVLLREGARHPKMMSIGLHPRLIGHPGRASALYRFFDRYAADQRIWFAKRIEIARHWASVHPSRLTKG